MTVDVSPEVAIATVALDETIYGCDLVESAGELSPMLPPLVFFGLFGYKLN